MIISSIKENRNAKSILITYKLKDVDCLVQLRLPDFLINFRQFSDIYLRIDQPFKYFEMVYAKSGFIKISAFKIAMMQLQKKPFPGSDMKVVDELLDNLESIEEDLKQRLIIVSLLPLNPKFEENEKNQLISRIKGIDDEVRKNVKNINPQWQLLYVVQTTVKQIWNGEERCIIKLGKTNKPIEEYIPNLRENYQFKIDFQAVFAQRLYTPGKTLIDTKHFHNKILQQIPDNKIYLQANDDDNDLHLHYEFYFLTKEFVDSFEKLLWDFIETYKSKYTEEQIENSNSQHESDDNTIINPIVQVQEKSYEPILPQESNDLSDSETDQTQKIDDPSYNLTTANIEQKEEKEQEFKLKNESQFIIPPKDLSENGAKLILEALKMTKTKDSLLNAFLYQAQREREEEQAFKNGN